MSRRPAPRKSWFSLLLVAAAVAIWLYNGSQLVTKPGGKSVPGWKPASPGELPVPEVSRKSQTSKKSTRYEMFENCTLAEARNNDGDSFFVRLPDGRTEEFRLYFVDTPETDFKTYPDGKTNHERIRQQAAEMGDGITPEQAVEIGKKGRKFTLDLLASRPFTLYTEWDSPFRDNRYHAHIRIQQNGKPRWLHQLLIEKGLARIKTKPADLPNGIPAHQEEDHLRQLERAAKRADAGAWGL
ncbi:hypothetical protein JIN84_10620 [Luteolibacter yonseiensis]|uniref:TNase-like domain-containing protein n=1 Tax=Luteolibacter yonseiensis TaxID=1144680 RepID=A0A934VBL7_9BACT|nr:hypothetical protein [Luteolibacter yonseiensis]MBK1816066.1 hypothetical protein [Luteolibacter yonseiensis]